MRLIVLIYLGTFYAYCQLILDDIQQVWAQNFYSTPYHEDMNPQGVQDICELFFSSMPDIIN